MEYFCKNIDTVGIYFTDASLKIVIDLQRF